MLSTQPQGRLRGDKEPWSIGVRARLMLKFVSHVEKKEMSHHNIVVTGQANFAIRDGVFHDGPPRFHTQVQKYYFFDSK